jgi:hypothetical protein
MKISEIAINILDDLGNPSGVTFEYVTGWLDSNIGRLNNIINSSFESSGDYFTETGILTTNDEEVILKDIFLERYYQRKATENLGATSYDWISITNEDGSIRRVTKSDLAKQYSALSRDARDRVKDNAKEYKISKSRPMQIIDNGERVTSYGDDID